MIIVSGPSSVGKSTLIARLLAVNQLTFIVPTTTREIRASEELPDRDYEFLDVPAFQAGIRAGEFADWDYALGNYYGFRRTRFIDTGPIAITHALARMAVRLRANHLTATLIFLRPADERAHIARVYDRFAGDEPQQARLRHWREELAQEALFDHVLTVSGASEAVSPQYADFWKGLGLAAP